MNYYFTEEELLKMKEFYISGMSCQEIKDLMGLPHTVRSIQRRIKSLGVMRTTGDAFRNAMAKGRVKWAYKENKKHRTKLSPKLRYKILERDGWKCILCGARAETSNLEIDHINQIPDDNRESNLRTLCHDCNFGRPRS